MSERHDKILGASNEQSFKVLETFELPGLLHELLPMGPKHPIREKFTKNLF